MLRAALFPTLLAASAALAPAGCGEAPTSPRAAESATAQPSAPGAARGATPADIPVTAPVVAPVAAPVAAAGDGSGDATGSAAPPPAAAAAEPRVVEERSGVTSNGLFVVTWAPVPDPIPFNEAFKLQVSVARAATPTERERAAGLEVDATMPAHGHGMNRTPHVLPNGDGTFLVEGMLFHMSGEWNLIFHVRSGTEYGQAILRLELP
jgi:hypothetical protein